MDERFLPVLAGQVHAYRLDPGRADRVQRGPDVGYDEGQVVRPGAAGGQEPLEERRVRSAGRGEQFDLGAGGELELAPPESAELPPWAHRPPSRPPNRAQPLARSPVPIAT